MLVRMWAIVLAAMALLLLLGLSFEAVVGTAALLFFVAWIVIEFLNVRLWLIRLFHRYVPEPDSVDNTTDNMYRDTTPYASARNARQERRSHD
jgi:hypothetical protein